KQSQGRCFSSKVQESKGFDPIKKLCNALVSRRKEVPVKINPRLLCSLAFLLGVGSLTISPRRGYAYVEAPYTLGRVIQESTNIMVVRVEKVAGQKHVIVYRKERDLTAKHNGAITRHNISRNGFHAREWQFPMEWAEVGKTAIFFHNGGAS